MKCVYCGTDACNNKHTNACPYNPINIYKIVIYLRDYLLVNSKFNKSFKPFPNPKELDKFLRKNKIMRLKTIRRRYFEDNGKLEEWLLEILSISITCAIISDNEFPYYLLYIYDNWLFKSKEDYEKNYELAIAFEDGDSLGIEINGKQSFELPEGSIQFDGEVLEKFRIVL